MAEKLSQKFSFFQTKFPMYNQKYLYLGIKLVENSYGFHSSEGIQIHYLSTSFSIKILLCPLNTHTHTHTHTYTHPCWACRTVEHRQTKRTCLFLCSNSSYDGGTLSECDTGFFFGGGWGEVVMVQFLENQCKLIGLH